jgi:hypothetical protein
LCGKENIWVSTDETADASGRKVANVVIGVLKNDHTLSEKSFLLSCKEMSAVKHTTIARVFNKAAGPVARWCEIWQRVVAVPPT